MRQSIVKTSPEVDGAGACSLGEAHELVALSDGVEDHHRPEAAAILPDSPGLRSEAARLSGCSQRLYGNTGSPVVATAWSSTIKGRRRRRGRPVLLRSGQPL
jgi:hypothetical protein